MATPHNVVRILGTAAGGETWSINPRFVQSGGGSVTSYTDLLAWATAIGTANSGKCWPQPMLDLLSASGFLTGVRVEAIDSAGKLEQAAEYSLATPGTGSGVPSKPLQVAWVVSLLTGRPGRSFRGRLFLPAWGNPAMDGTARVPSAARVTVSASVRTWLNSVQDAAPGEGVMGLAVVSPTTGTFNFVTQLSLGDVLDTQRRRRDALVEQRTTIDYAI